VRLDEGPAPLLLPFHSLLGCGLFHDFLSVSSRPFYLTSPPHDFDDLIFYFLFVVAAIFPICRSLPLHSFSGHSFVNKEYPRNSESNNIHNNTKLNSISWPTQDTTR
jgi:hypothetical protein